MYELNHCTPIPKKCKSCIKSALYFSGVREINLGQPVIIMLGKIDNLIIAKENYILFIKKPFSDDELFEEVVDLIGLP
jgi:hypothetical protein